MERGGGVLILRGLGEKIENKLYSRPKQETGMNENKERMGLKTGVNETDDGSEWD